MEEVLTIDSSVKQERNSAFEILRIVAIIFIIAHHFAVHGGFDFQALENSALITVNKIWVDFIYQLGKAGVNLFVLISAYFLINNKFKSRKFLYIVIEMLFFSVVFGLSFFFINRKEFSLSLFKSIVFPFGSSTWWFMASYLLLYIFSPFLNLGIKAMRKKMHFFLIVLLFIIWSLLPTFLNLDYGFTNFGWFITLYFIGAYIKIYNVSIKFKPYIGILLSASIFVIWFFIKTGISLLFGNDNYIATRIINWFNLANINNFVQVSATIILFLAFKNIKMKNNKVINIVSSTILAIYLFHDHVDVRNFLWIELFKNATYATSQFMILYSIGVIFCVFAVGVIIGLFYKYTIGLGVNRLLNILDKKCLYRIDNIFNHDEIDKE